MFYIVFEPGKRTKISVKIGWRTIAWCRSRIHFAQAWFCYLQSGSEVSLNDLTCFQRDLDKFDECLFIEQRDLETVELLSRPSVVIVHLLIRDLNGPSDWFNSQHDFHVKNTVKWSIFYTWNCTFESRSAVWNFSLIYLLHLWLEVVSYALVVVIGGV